MPNERKIVTVNSKGMITIPAKIAKKYGIKKSTKVEVIDTGHGILLVPIPSLDELFGVDETETTKRIIDGIHESRRNDLELEK